MTQKIEIWVLPHIAPLAIDLIGTGLIGMDYTYVRK